MTYAPFLKWAGGKRWLSQHAERLVPLKFGHYREPFVGGGAMFFALAPTRGVLSDINEDLICCYRQIKYNWQKVEAGLRHYAGKHSSEFYYLVRSMAPRSELKKAVRFLYLNRSCFNGIYRVNQFGEFNVPKGSKDRIIFPYDDFRRVSEDLKGIDLRVCDFEDVINDSKSGDFIFCDPPYTVTHNNNGFIRYNDRLFAWEDQVRLCNALKSADRRGVHFLLTNANHLVVRNLYEKDFRIETLVRASVIAADNENRGKFDEIIVTNYAVRLFN
jgi:DNA adenine methylase